MNAPDTVVRFIAENQIVTHDIAQGTPAWHTFRGKFFGASEAAAMLGLSKKVSRNELLRAKSTGIAKEFSDFVQERILDRGHEVEALARPIIEAQIGRSLFPVTCSRGTLSASCDGRAAADDLTWEHKQWNEELAESVRNKILPDEHWPQCQQNLLVTGAERLIFTVSDGTADRMVSMEVLPDHAKFAQLIAGWAQFEKDLPEYQHVEEAPKPEGRAPDQLPALRIELVGQVSASNLAEFHGHALAVLDSIKTDLQTDEDFANADKTVKWCGDVESRLDAAKQHALSQTETIDKLFRTIDAIKEETRQKRLTLEKLVKARKDAIRVELVQAANAKFADHVAGLQSEITGAQLSLLVSVPDFGGAIKGLKTITSLRNAIDTALANGQIAADTVAKDVRDKLAWYDKATGIEAGSYGFLFPNLQQLIGMDRQAFEAVVKNRIAEHQKAEAAKLEEQRARIQAEEEAKARAKVQEEERARQMAMLEAERKRLAELDAASSSAGKQEVKPVTLDEVVHATAPAAVAEAIAPTTRTRPTKLQMAQAIADRYGVSVLTADEWLRAEFSLIAA